MRNTTANCSCFRQPASHFQNQFITNHIYTVDLLHRAINILIQHIMKEKHLLLKSVKDKSCHMWGHPQNHFARHQKYRIMHYVRVCSSVPGENFRLSTSQGFPSSVRTNMSTCMAGSSDNVGNTIIYRWYGTSHKKFMQVTFLVMTLKIFCLWNRHKANLS